MRAEPRWQKTSFSGADDNQDCLELATTLRAVLLRESDAPRTVIATSRTRMAALITRIKAGGPR
ncbi:DUF397 domain-containing protein [Streptomyces sp. NPDC037389]|uniref:DUF397 domain-containing protein n=1 Tax=Streptomyces sp. NPDC037389 TaxID=3155369 RepID=UPI0034098CF4